MNQTKPETKDVKGQLPTNCNVNMAFNFTVGAVATAAALLIGYFLYVYW